MLPMRGLKLAFTVLMQTLRVLCRSRSDLTPENLALRQQHQGLSDHSRCGRLLVLNLVPYSAIGSREDVPRGLGRHEVPVHVQKHRGRGPSPLRWSHLRFVPLQKCGGATVV